MTSIDINLMSKMSENERKYAKSSILLCKWPQYHFSMVFMMININSNSLLVCQMNIYWNSTHVDVNWRQYNVEMIEKTQIRQFLSCKWPQYHFSMVFMMVFIDFLVLLVCRTNIFRKSTHMTSIDVNLMSKMIENAQNRQF